MAGAGIATECQADGAMDRTQPVGLARPRAGDPRQRFGKGSSRARGHGAAEAAHPDEQDGRAAETRDIAEAAPVDPVNPPGRHAALGARGRCGCRLRA